MSTATVTALTAAILLNSATWILQALWLSKLSARISKLELNAPEPVHALHPADLKWRNPTMSNNLEPVYLAIKKVRTAAEDARRGLSDTQYVTFLEDMLVIAQGWRSELREIAARDVNKKP